MHLYIIQYFPANSSCAPSYYTFSAAPPSISGRTTCTCTPLNIFLPFLNVHSHISSSVYFTAFIHEFNLEVGRLAFPAVWDFPSCPMSASKSHILHSKQSGHGCPWSLHCDHCRRGLDHYPIIDSFLIFVGLHQFWGRESHITSGAPLLCSVFLVLGASQPPFWTQFSQHQYLHLPHGISTFAYVAAVGVDLAIAEVLLHVVAILPAVVVAPLSRELLFFLAMLRMLIFSRPPNVFLTMIPSSSHVVGPYPLFLAIISGNSRLPALELILEITSLKLAPLIPLRTSWSFPTVSLSVLLFR